METVTLSREEYDKLKNIESEFDIIKNQPDKFVKIQVPSIIYDRMTGKSKIQYNEFRILSGKEAIDAMKRHFEDQITTLSDHYGSLDKRNEELEKENSKFRKNLHAIEELTKTY